MLAQEDTHLFKETVLLALEHHVVTRNWLMKSFWQAQQELQLLSIYNSLVTSRLRRNLWVDSSYLRQYVGHFCVSVALLCVRLALRCVRYVCCICGFTFFS